jgi:hypothetical protein
MECLWMPLIETPSQLYIDQNRFKKMYISYQNVSYIKCDRLLKKCIFINKVSFFKETNECLYGQVFKRVRMYYILDIMLYFYIAIVGPLTKIYLKMRYIYYLFWYFAIPTLSTKCQTENIHNCKLPLK